ncbi:antibiotic biosynthesis monooxygenase domain-containing protein [Sarocladium implicatum]|nr:antibiotic biosynthesis monooxygenase domain-containing protein [Sarocladium implicatum]
MAPIQLTAIITPKPGKADRFLELFQTCVDYVQKHEPYIHRYELHRGLPEKNGKQRFVVLEGYDHQEGLDKHMKTPPVQALLKAVEEEKLTDTDIIMTQDGPGVKSRL